MADEMLPWPERARRIIDELDAEAGRSGRTREEVLRDALDMMVREQSGSKQEEV